MAKATVVETEKEVVTKVKQKTGVTLELTAQEANLIFYIIGKTLADNGLAISIHNALSKVCIQHEPDWNKSPIIANDALARKCINSPLK